MGSFHVPRQHVFFAIAYLLRVKAARIIAWATGASENLIVEVASQ